MAESETITFKNLDKQFVNAASYVKSIAHELTSQQALQFYGLYKQATEGSCYKSKPSWFNFTEKQKWEAWSQLKKLSSKDAMQKYINLLSQIYPGWEEKPIENNAWIHHSRMKNNDEVIADSNKTIFDWVKEKNLDKVKIESKNITEEINMLDETGMSLLHWAADRGSLDIVKYLVENLNADVNLQDTNGQTPLHYAVSCEYKDIANYLVDQGANTNILDNDGLTPYQAGA